ncbi:8-amino-7-oxononanoate synthase [Psychrobacillus sp. L3]|uniref:8-amino-7-oxononanoate synthase n=1 Tax=Psychrobacillus sp. L3 TaxID=3236891 RepID=UPI0036F3ACD3
MKKLLLTLTFLVLFSSLYSASAEAAYLKSSDKTISINTGLKLTIPLNLGEKAFKLQENVHDIITKSTGLEVDHYYLWLEVDGEKVIGIDPAKGMF